MRLLQVIDLHHQWPLDLTRRRVRRPTLVHQPGNVLGLKPPDPCVDGRPRDVHILAHAPCIPAVVIALDDLHPSPMAVGRGVIVPQPQVPLTGNRTRLPECLEVTVLWSIDTPHVMNRMRASSREWNPSSSALSRSISCLTTSGPRGTRARTVTSTSSGRSPTIPCCRNRWVSVRTVEGCVSVSSARCRGVRSAKRTMGRITS